MIVNWNLYQEPVLSYILKFSERYFYTVPVPYLLSGRIFNGTGKKNWQQCEMYVKCTKINLIFILDTRYITFHVFSS
jgi:hypothetical protein